MIPSWPRSDLPRPNIRHAFAKGVARARDGSWPMKSGSFSVEVTTLRSENVALREDNEAPRLENTRLKVDNQLLRDEIARLPRRPRLR